VLYKLQIVDIFQEPARNLIITTFKRRRIVLVVLVIILVELNILNEIIQQTKVVKLYKVLHLTPNLGRLSGPNYIDELVVYVA
jgi:hypothetical protein